MGEAGIEAQMTFDKILVDGQEADGVSGVTWSPKLWDTVRVIGQGTPEGFWTTITFKVTKSERKAMRLRRKRAAGMHTRWSEMGKKLVFVEGLR